MAVEILTVSLSDESIERIALLVAAKISSSTLTTESNYPSAQTHRTQSESAPQAQADPWATASAPQAPSSATQAPVQPQAVPQSPPAQQAGNNCVHGPMRYVPAGYSKVSGKAYAAFYGCTAPRGAQQCRSIPAA